MSQRITLAQFKRAAGLPASKKGFEGHSYMSIHNFITNSADRGLAMDEITEGQHQQLIDWRDRVLDSMSF